MGGAETARSAACAEWVVKLSRGLRDVVYCVDAREVNYFTTVYVNSH